jgi:hypothetical protein
VFLFKEFLNFLYIETNGIPRSTELQLDILRVTRIREERHAGCCGGHFQ